MIVLLSLILWLVVIGVVWYFVGKFPLPTPIGQIIQVLFVILVIFMVLSLFGITGYQFPLIKFPG